MLGRWGHIVPSLSRGLAGQTLAFAAMVIPVALSPAPALILIVVSSSIASAALYPSVLAAPAVYPSVRSEDEALVHLRAAFTTLLMVAVVITVVGAVLVVLAIDDGKLLAAAAILLCQGYDALFVSWIVRRGEVEAIGSNRLRYGVTSVSVTTCVAATWNWSGSLVVAAVATYVIASFWNASHYRDELRQTCAALLAVHSRAVREQRRRSGRAVFAYVMNGATNNITGITAHALGPLAAPWAVIIRVTGGFLTVSTQLIAPSFDARIAKSIRGQSGDLSRTLALGFLSGIVLAATSIGIALAATWSTGHMGDLPARDVVSLCVAAALYWGSLTAVAPIFKVLILTGNLTSRLLWDVSRFAVIVPLAALLHGPGALLPVAGAMAVFNLLLLALTFRATRGIDEDRKRSGATQGQGGAAASQLVGE